MLVDNICSLLNFRRVLIITIIILGVITSTMAQQNSSSDEETIKKSFIGIGLRLMPYDAIGSPEYQMPALDVPFIQVNYSYRLNNRVVAQIGLGYGMNEASHVGVSRHIDVDSIYMKESYQQISAVAMPLSIRWTPFNLSRRLQFYGNASLIPLFRDVKVWANESLNGSASSRTELYNKTISEFTATISAGVFIQYSFSSRWSVYAEADLAHYNLEQRHLTTSFSKSSKGIGLNYNFNLKRDK